ncbi:hypothetical protein FM104_01385 [Microbacterium esteraromaticum]|uniref:Alpha/beta hydrolase n=1 Tax=Microbacterium esteraromaticum TaxID=57043 RepID=A0A1R4ICG0_9MICO|nr:hypothetical protein [Microbacterium esteraromaticum]SJN17406.1 hypothetical protein FM104_01385 [Microbacterium esteraromaticum]
MSGELNITAGGAVSVDSEAFRAVGVRLESVAEQLSRAGELVGRARHTLVQLAESSRFRLSEIWACAARLQQLAVEATDDATGTQIMADVFELVELRAEQQALAVNQPRAAFALQPRIEALLQAYPQTENMATTLVAGWSTDRFEGLFEQPIDQLLLASGVTYGGLLPIMLSAVISDKVVSATSKGSLPFGASLQGEAPPVHVSESSRKLVDGGPRTLTEALERIPKEDAQIRIEKRTYADGSADFIAYLDGTRSFLSGTEQPWDMGSNWDMYVDQERAASYEATMKALEMAGAEPGDRVDFVAYSQAGMIADHAAMSGPYETKMVVSVGNPVQPSLGADQTLVELRHTDDPVGTALSAGGSFGGTGASDSITITREAAHGLVESSFHAHLFDKYLETAQMADASGDVRIEALQKTLADRDTAVTVEQVDYVAKRP